MLYDVHTAVILDSCTATSAGPDRHLKSNLHQYRLHVQVSREKYASLAPNPLIRWFPSRRRPTPLKLLGTQGQDLQQRSASTARIGHPVVQCPGTRVIGNPFPPLQDWGWNDN